MDAPHRQKFFDSQRSLLHYIYVPTAWVSRCNARGRVDHQRMFFWRMLRVYTPGVFIMVMIPRIVQPWLRWKISRFPILCFAVLLRSWLRLPVVIAVNFSHRSREFRPPEFIWWRGFVCSLDRLGYMGMIWTSKLPSKRYYGTGRLGTNSGRPLGSLRGVLQLSLLF